MNTSKETKRALRQYAEQAYHKEMKSALELLYEDFLCWKQDNITGDQLNEKIHEFHDRSSRDIYNRYNTSHLNLAVAYAIHRGVLSREEVAAKLIETLSNELAFLQHQDEEGG